MILNVNDVDNVVDDNVDSVSR